MSKIEDIGNEQRPKNTSINKANQNNEYDSNNPDAISDGDEPGKGLNNGKAGGKTDIKRREELKKINLFSGANEYPLA